MSVECFWLGIEGVKAIREFNSSGEISSINSYSNLMDMVEDRGIERDEEFVYKYLPGLSNGYEGDYREMLKNEGAFEPTDEELDDMFKLIYLNIPRQISFSKEHDISFDDACEFENMMWFALEEQLNSKEGEDLFNVYNDITRKWVPSGIGKKIRNNFSNMTDDKKRLFVDYVEFAREFSNERLEDEFCLEDEDILNQAMVDVCEFVLRNVNKAQNESCVGFNN